MFCRVTYFLVIVSMFCINASAQNRVRLFAEQNGEDVFLTWRMMYWPESAIGLEIRKSSDSNWEEAEIVNGRAILYTGDSIIDWNHIGGKEKFLLEVKNEVGRYSSIEKFLNSVNSITELNDKSPKSVGEYLGFPGGSGRLMRRLLFGQAAIDSNVGKVDGIEYALFPIYENKFTNYSQPLNVCKVIKPSLIKSIPNLETNEELFSNLIIHLRIPLGEFDKYILNHFDIKRIDQSNSITELRRMNKFNDSTYDDLHFTHFDSPKRTNFNPQNSYTYIITPVSMFGTEYEPIIVDYEYREKTFVELSPGLMVRDAHTIRDAEGMHVNWNFESEFDEHLKEIRIYRKSKSIPQEFVATVKPDIRTFLDEDYPILNDEQLDYVIEPIPSGDAIKKISLGYAPHYFSPINPPLPKPKNVQFELE